MGTVKYTGPVASFHCPTEATIRSLKVHFSPKQEGSGDPNPENVREIVGWDGVEVNKSGRNLMHLVGYSAVNLTTTTATRKLTNGNGTTINTINPEKSVTITQTLWPATNKYSYQNGYFIVLDNNLKFEERYDVSFRVTNITNNPLNATLSDLMLYNPKGTSVGNTKIIDGDCITFKNAIYNQNTSTPLRHGFDIRICGMSCTISDFIVTAVDTKDRTYEPYCGETIDYEFGVLGKNKFNWNVPSSESSPANSDATTAREFTLDTYVIGMSVNNYYRQNYANWVLNPSVENGVISFSSGGASGYGIAFPLKLVAGQTYFLSGTGNGIVGITYYDENGELISYQNNRLNKTITVPENAATTLIGFYANTSNTDFTFSDIQLELGSSATTYEPYNPNKTVYGGWVDLITGEVCEEWKSITIDGTYNTYVSGDSYRGTNCTDAWFNINANNWGYSASYSYNLTEKDTQCETFNLISKAIWQNPDLYPWCYVLNSSNQIHCVFDNATIGITSDDTNTEAITKIKAWINENPIKVAYRLSESKATSYSIAPTSMQTFLAQNNVWSNADYVEVEYDLHETQNILARKQFIMANQPHVVKPAVAPLQNFTTDVPAPLKECKVHFKPIQDLHGYDKPWVGGNGKNLYNSSTDTQNSWIRANEPVGEITSTKYDYNLSDYIAVKPNTTYTINYNAMTDASAAGMVFFSSKNAEDIVGSISLAYQTKLNNNSTSYTFTTDQNCNYLRFSTFPAASNIQLELGSTATSYEPYENICPIEGWDGMEVYKTGKNLCDTSTSADITTNWLINGGSFDKTIYGLPVDKTFTLQANITKDLGENVSNTRFYLNGKLTNGKFFSTGTPMGIKSISNQPADDGTLRLAHNRLGLTKYDAEFNNIQLELGSVATEYESYNGTTIPITFPSEAGTIYGGYVDLVNGELVQTWNYIRANERTWSNYSAYRVFYTNNSDRSADSRDISDKLESYTGYGWDNAPDNSIISGNRNSMFIKHLGVSSNAEFKEWLDEVDPIVYYKLAEPIHYTLTPTQLKTLRGTNNIWASNGGDNIEIAYWKH